MGWDLHINSGISRISFGQTNSKVITCKKDGLYSNKVFSAEEKKNANTSVQWKCPACRDKFLTRLANCVRIKVKIVLFSNNLLTCIAQDFRDVMNNCALHFSPTNKNLPFKVSYTFLESKNSRLWCVANKANCGWLTSLRKPEKPTDQIAESCM